jgi:hypothetical protein
MDFYGTASVVAQLAQDIADADEFCIAKNRR